ncbi:MAG: hypothetical protein R3275_06415 [Saprospiraceae bacterium]|nr:hypothetical protein [Saprospiraceae bacterium]
MCEITQNDLEEVAMTFGIWASKTVDDVAEIKSAMQPVPSITWFTKL